MSVYSRITSDQSVLVFPLETTPASIEGYNLSNASSTAYGTLTQQNISYSGGIGSYIFGSNGYITGSGKLNGNNAQVNDANFAFETVFRKSSKPSDYATLLSTNDSSFRMFVAIDTDGHIYAATSGNGTKTVVGTINVADNKWHHVVVKLNGGGTPTITIWVDGVADGTSNANADAPQMNTTYFIGRFYNSAASRWFNGEMDIAAIYSPAITGTTLTDAKIVEHANDFKDAYNNRVVSASVTTATTLMVHPAITTTKNINYSSSAMTASALMPNGVASGFNLIPALPVYIGSLNLKEYLKMDSATLANSGSLGSDTYYYDGSVIGYPYIGPANNSALAFNSTPTWTDAGRTQNNFSLFGPSNLSGLFGTDISFGVWVKFESATSEFRVIDTLKTDPETQQYVHSGYWLNIHNGIPQLKVYMTDESVVTITGTNTLSTNKWHFLAVRNNGTGISLYANNQLIGNVTSSLTPNDSNVVAFGGGPGGGEFFLSSFVADTTSVLGTSQLTKIYNYGSVFNQANIYMPEPLVKISTNFYDKSEAYNAVFDFRMDASGVPFNYGTGESILALKGSPSNIVSGISGKTINAYEATSTNSSYTGVWSAPSGTFSTNNEISVVAIMKADPDNYGTTEGPYGSWRQILSLGAGHPNDSYGNGLILGFSNTSYLLYTAEDGFNAEYYATSETLDDKWHVIGATFDGSDLKLYIDGQLKSTTATSNVYITDTGHLELLGGEDEFWSIPSSTTAKYLDAVSVFNTVLTAQDMFEFYQSVSFITPMTANATLELPVGVFGYGPTINPGVMYASGLLVDPTQQDTVRQLPTPMTAFATSVTPNYGATTVINVNYSGTVMTASAELHDPGYDIGEVNGAVPMDASALMPNALFSTPGRIQVNPGIALDAKLPMPGIVTVKGAKIFAETLTARGILPLPPQYIQLTDDEYYNRLYRIHSQQRIQPIQQNLSSSSTQATTEIARSFLNFFNDTTADITPGSSSYVYNEMPEYVYAAPGTQYDNNGNVVPPDTTKRGIVSSAPRGANTPTPIISKGYFDAWDRKAVNITNIELNTGTDEVYWNKNKAYSLELIFKTTKSNQIIAYGNWQSFQYYQRSIGTIGLFNGKIYSMESSQNIGKADIIPHPSNIDALTKANLNTSYIESNKRVDDGQWHHIVFQRGWDDYRTQIWIDGVLDKQIRTSNYATSIRPSIIGFNSNDSKLSSDFQTSVISWIPQGFLTYRDIELNYERAFKYTPYEAEPMVGSISATPNNIAAGNRGRLLMLYFWPTTAAQRYGDIEVRHAETFDPVLTTLDYVSQPPQEYEGWDVFPVDVTGYFISDLVKPESYGQVSYGDSGGHILTTGDLNKPKFKFNSDLTFKDRITDSPRYIDVINDIDLKLFDAIAFKNFPDQSFEIDAYAGNEIVDSYFNVRETKIYEDFLKSLRKAVDLGLSLYVTNQELALDLGIIDRIETVSDMDGSSDYYSDPYSPTIAPPDSASLPVATGVDVGVNVWYDSYKNNRFRLVNEVPGLTDLPGWIYTDSIYWRNDDQIRWAGPDRLLSRIVEKPNGLAVGDEWIEANYVSGGINMQAGPARTYAAVPFANIKAGIPVTAFANQIRNGLNLIDNPYKNHATSIVVRPGDILNGTPCGGKIYVNFTERLDGSREETGIDLITDSRINYAYNAGILTLAEATGLENASYNLDRQLENGSITQQEYNKLVFWTSNGQYVLQQNIPFGDNSDSPTGGGIVKPKASRVRKINKAGSLTFVSGGTGSQWFSSLYAWQYPRATIYTPSMLTRGFWWISNKEVPEGTVIRVLAMQANATMPAAAAVPDKNKVINATAMLANTTIVNAVGYRQSAANITTLPLEAFATMNNNLFVVPASVMTANVTMRPNVRAITTEIDQVIVYVMHEDPILYLREDVIK